MASIHKTAAGHTNHWRYGGRQFNQSAGTDSRAEAKSIKGRIEDTSRALTDGWLSLPEGADYDTVKRFLFTGGKRAEKDAIAAPRHVLTLDALFRGARHGLN